MLAQGVVKDHEDLDSLGNQRRRQDPEEEIGHHVGVPLPLSQESVDRGEMSGFVKLYGNNDLADGVFAYGQLPSDNKRNKDPKTGSAEQHPESDLVNPERRRCRPFRLGVLPHRVVLCNGGMRGTSCFVKNEISR
jgi:hypothetical protein